MSCTQCTWYRTANFEPSRYCTHPSLKDPETGKYVSVKGFEHITICKHFTQAKICGECYWYDPKKEYCPQQTSLKIDYSITTNTKACDIFFTPVDPEHTCEECDYYYEASGFTAGCKHQKVAKLFNRNEFKKHPACKKHFKKQGSSEPVQKLPSSEYEQYTCNLCGWYAEKGGYCNRATTFFVEPQKQACEHFKLNKFKKTKNICGQCFFYEKIIDGPVTEEHCKRKNGFATVNGPICSEFIDKKTKTKKLKSKLSKIAKKPEKKKDPLGTGSKLKKILDIALGKKPGRTCGECHFLSNTPHGFVDQTYECLYGNIPHLVSKDSDASKCAHFGPKVKAKDGSVCSSCVFLSTSKEHCVHRNDPGNTFPKGDDCTFYELKKFASKSFSVGVVNEAGQPISTVSSGVTESIKQELKPIPKDANCFTCMFCSIDQENCLNPSRVGSAEIMQNNEVKGCNKYQPIKKQKKIKKSKKKSCQKPPKLGERKLKFK